MGAARPGAGNRRAGPGGGAGDDPRGAAPGRLAAARGDRPARRGDHCRAASAADRCGCWPVILDEEKLYAARLHATRARPYLAAALFALHPVASTRVPTM